VAIVAPNNEIKLLFRATAILGPQRVTLANGENRPNGYVIRAIKERCDNPCRQYERPSRVGMLLELSGTSTRRR
jgi:hypothetical protein